MDIERLSNYLEIQRQKALKRADNLASEGINLLRLGKTEEGEAKLNEAKGEVPELQEIDFLRADLIDQPSTPIIINNTYLSSQQSPNTEMHHEKSAQENTEPLLNPENHGYSPGEILNSLITSKTRQQVLKELLLPEPTSLHVREIVRRTGREINAIRRELENLEKSGLLVSHYDKNKKYFSVSPNPALNRFIKPLSQILSCGFGITESRAYLNTSEEGKTTRMSWQMRDAKVKELTLQGINNGNEIAKILGVDYTEVVSSKDRLYKSGELNRQIAPDLKDPLDYGLQILALRLQGLTPTEIYNQRLHITKGQYFSARKTAILFAQIGKMQSAIEEGQPTLDYLEPEYKNLSKADIAILAAALNHYTDSLQDIFEPEQIRIPNKGVLRELTNLLQDEKIETQNIGSQEAEAAITSHRIVAVGKIKDLLSNPNIDLVLENIHQQNRNVGKLLRCLAQLDQAIDGGLEKLFQEPVRGKGTLNIKDCLMDNFTRKRLEIKQPPLL